jgi:hypothetical protein
MTGAGQRHGPDKGALACEAQPFDGGDERHVAGTSECHGAPPARRLAGAGRNGSWRQELRWGGIDG